MTTPNAREIEIAKEHTTGRVLDYGWLARVLAEYRAELDLEKNAAMKKVLMKAAKIAPYAKLNDYDDLETCGRIEQLIPSEPTT